LEINGGPIVRYLNPPEPPRSGVQLVKDKSGAVNRILISYELMRKEVFDHVIESTLGLLKRQIDKANGKIKRTYLVGGFGRSPYLQLRVRKRFTFEETGECLVGELVTDNRGDTAAMRGAMYYGIDGSQRSPQSDIVLNEFETGKDQFNTLVCLGDYSTIQYYSNVRFLIYVVTVKFL
jgi:molecular chaperone DnaK (HSP70)